MSGLQRLISHGLIALIAASVAVHLAFAAYLHGGRHRAQVEASLTEYFELPCTVSRIQPRTFNSTAFKNIELWLPNRRDRVFQCEEAVWQTDPAPPHVATLQLSTGILALGTDKWTLDDYRQLLDSGFRHDFEELRRVNISEFDFTFRRRELLISMGGASGTVRFDTPDLGIGSLTAYTLNGFGMREPVRVHARIRPNGKTLIEEMGLEIPEVPLAGLGLEKPLGGPVSRGRFRGRLLLREESEGPGLVISGRVFDVDVLELTRLLPIGPLHGAAELLIDRAEFRGGLPTLVQGRASLSGVPLEDFATLLGMRTLSGQASLNISEADIAGGHLLRLVINGRVEGVELNDVAARFGEGRVTGRLTVTVNALRIENDRIAAADIDISATPPEGAAGVIDRDLLLDLGNKLAGFSLPSAIPKSVVPPRIAYTQFGLRLLVKDNIMRVLGSHGDSNDTILTVTLLGTNWGIVKQLKSTIDLTPWVDAVRDRASSYDPRRLRGMFRGGS